MKNITVDTNKWTKESLLLSMWRGSEYAPVINIYGVNPPNEPSEDDLKYAVSKEKNRKPYRHDCWCCDYVRGRAIKTSFINWPEINYERYDDYNGQGSFLKILKLK